MRVPGGNAGLGCAHFVECSVFRSCALRVREHVKVLLHKRRDGGEDRPRVIHADRLDMRPDIALGLRDIDLPPLAKSLLEPLAVAPVREPRVGGRCLVEGSGLEGAARSETAALGNFLLQIEMHGRGPRRGFTAEVHRGGSQRRITAEVHSGGSKQRSGNLLVYVSRNFPEPSPDPQGGGNGGNES